MAEFEGKVALVTGGSRGIGKAIVRMLARQGASVAFNYVRSQGPAEELAAEIRDSGGTCLVHQVDVQDFDAVKAWTGEVQQELGGLDFVVNNAGITADRPLMMMTPDDWHRVINTNLTGMFHTTRACIVPLLKQKRGNVVNISSVSGVIGLPGQTNYSAAKGGMNAFTKALARETAAYGLHVNAVAPGFIETDMIRDMDEAAREKILSEIPLSRLGSADEVASSVRFLLSEESHYITGQVLQIDGGLAIR
ncbi:MAG: 3-oxoacyl-[acyl-carrier-protein] reductase [Candidatus Omnitrophota bacterium]